MNLPRVPSTAPSAKPARWRAWLAALVVGGLLGFALSPWLQRNVGVLDNGRWFVDSYALLATSDAVRQGLDPAQANPLDIYRRPHSYTHWWFALGRLGLTRADNFLLGGVLVALFLSAALLNLAPRSRGELAWQVALLLSPPLLLALNRANNDLLVFALLGWALWLARRPVGARPAWLGVAAALATGLKFFPVVAAGAVVILRPARRGVAWAAASSVLALLVFASVRADLAKAVFPQPEGLYLFGAPVFWRSVGWPGPGPMIVSLLLMAFGAAVLAWRRGTAGLAADDSPETAGERLAFMTGALLLLACFAAGISYAYRWVFALWLAPWLWRQATSAARPAERAVARLAGGLLTAGVWLDGLFCLTLNTLIPPHSEAQMLRWIDRWNVVTQPLVWLLVLLLAGWVAEALGATWRGWQRRADQRTTAGSVQAR